MLAGALRACCSDAMNTPANEAELESLLAEQVRQLVPVFLQEKACADMSSGNAAFLVIGRGGRIAGQVFGTEQSRGRWCLGIALRKASQVWATGHATGRFEELVYAGKLNEGDFGLHRPDLIGWEGGVPLRCADGTLVAAAFSGFPGERDVAIVKEAAARVPGLSLG